MFSGFMANAWIVGSVVAAVAGLVGFFVVVRGSAFPAHAIPNGAFAGAAAASLLGVDTLAGLGVASVLAASAIALLGRRGRHDVATALALVLMLALGYLFLSQTTEYSQQIFSLLFGEVLGISANSILPVVLLGLASLAAVAAVYRPLMVTSVLPEIGQAKGISGPRMELVFLLVVALATTMTVPVVGALLVFSLMVGAPAAARSFTDRPAVAIVASVGIALVTVWMAIALSFETNWPVGFFVGASSAVWYAAGRSYAAWRRSRLRDTRPGALPGSDRGTLPGGPGAGRGTGRGTGRQRAVAPAD